MAEYSVWYPATSSASASGRSKGSRLVSANAETKNTTNPTNCGRTFQPWKGSASQLPPCWSTTSVSLNEPPERTTPAAAVVIASSYEMICALERMPPIRENLLLDDQPARTIPDRK